MTFVVSLEGFTPPPRFDGAPWTQQRMDYSTDSAAGPWTTIETQNLAPVDADPTNPATRSMTTVLAPVDTAWFRLVFLDAGDHSVSSGAVYVSPDQFAALGRSVGELVDELLQIAGLDVPEDTALAWINDRHATMVARSRCAKQAVTLGTTDGTGRILAPGVVELYELRIDGQEYQRVRRQVVAGARRSQVTLSYPGLIFTSEADESGNATFEIYPTPDAGLEIEAYAAVYPPTLGRADRVMVPRTKERALIEGAFATGLAFDAEQIGAADRFEARFDSACEELRREIRRRDRGPGPAQILVSGVNA